MVTGGDELASTWVLGYEGFDPDREGVREADCAKIARAFGYAGFRLPITPATART